MDTFDRAQSYTSELYALREQIHRHPELGNHEYLTADLVEKTLNGLGIETERVTETAVIGTLRGGKPGLTVALRADMDALPMSLLDQK